MLLLLLLLLQRLHHAGLCRQAGFDGDLRAV
jgi:hypothetical protein